MKFSVAYNFDPTLIPRLFAFPEVDEVYGKLDRDCIGGGRSTYTLRRITQANLRAAVTDAHRHTIRFNYLINGASLDGLEQTKAGQRQIRKLLDYISEQSVDCVTIAAPYLLELVKKCYPHLRTRISVFALIDDPQKALAWQDMGADTLCISAIGCNRKFERLQSIRKAVSCDLQLIVNASCLPHCVYELTHMQLLSQSSRAGHRLGGFCLDYCFLHCSEKRIADPVNLIKAVWIRPEDLSLYEALGINNFKILERSCPTDLLVKRVAAYAARSWNGNLYELIAPVAQIKKELKPTGTQFLRMLLTMAKPWLIKPRAMLAMKKYAESAIPHEFTKKKAPIYIDNSLLNGFLEGFRERACDGVSCGSCGYCEGFAEKAITIDPEYQKEMLAMAGSLSKGLTTGGHWW